MGQNQTLTKKGFLVKNKFKKALFCAALAAGSGAYAAGPLDGAYACRVSFQGAGTFDAYLTMNTNAQGLSVAAVVAMGPQSHLYGYAIGVATVNSFIARTNYDMPVALTVDPQTLRVSGNYWAIYNGAPTPAAVGCNKIW